MLKINFVLLMVFQVIFFISCEDQRTKPKTIVDKDNIAKTDNDKESVDKDNEKNSDDTEQPDENDEEILPDDVTVEPDETNNDTVENETENEAPDDFVKVDICELNTDCAWNYICDINLEPNDCIKIGKCESDLDCSNMQKCERKEHWNECVTNSSPKFCSKDEDCGVGEFCQTDGILKICRSNNKCLDDKECLEGYECILQDNYYQCINTKPCEIDTDCKFGFICEIKEPENECIYANECVKDEDCGFGSACVVDGNKTKCKLLGGGLCSNDAECQIDEYCDLLLGLGGMCKSRNQCYKDEDCEDDRLKCESNGVYNECVPKNANWCLLDAMCDEGWFCIDNECRPPNYDQCKEIAGKWKVWFSGLSLVTFQDGEVYEFLPKNGCTGDIKKEGATVFLGSFKETSTSNYDIDFFLIYQCTAKVVLGNLMNISCPDGDAQLGRF